MFTRHFGQRPVLALSLVRRPHSEVVLALAAPAAGQATTILHDHPPSALIFTSILWNQITGFIPSFVRTRARNPDYGRYRASKEQDRLTV